MPFLEKESNSRAMDALMWTGDTYTSPDSPERSLEVNRLSAGAVQTQRRLCGSAECANGWTIPWRSRRRPIFEDQWGCSGRCMLTMVRAALRRARSDGAERQTAIPHRHRVPLGLLMLEQGWITHPQLRRALEMQRQNGTGRIGEWLIAECGIEAEQITRGLSLQWNCPVLGVEGFSPEAMALAMPGIFVEKFGLLPLRVAGERILYLAFVDCLDASAGLAMERMTRLKVESGVLNEAEFQSAKNRLLQCDGVEITLDVVSDVDTLAGRITAILEQKQPVASRLVRLHQYYWLRLWLERGTTGTTGILPRSGEDMKDYVFTVGLNG